MKRLATSKQTLFADLTVHLVKAHSSTGVGSICALRANEHRTFASSCCTSSDNLISRAHRSRCPSSLPTSNFVDATYREPASSFSRLSSPCSSRESGFCGTRTAPNSYSSHSLTVRTAWVNSLEGSATGAVARRRVGEHIRRGRLESAEMKQEKVLTP
ncbi:hypothetical protein SCHPADRAFT_758231 [Schizopora paradoxa]|uniref:Uncharacterized protein n=1 Tax=Schizopora paradoxa TaxID=27342 RepID=A0A0H2R442_9AGAM|nr:hypothetical protein SCHPADRAFT_758231 [Schizopora paradoxa]